MDGDGTIRTETRSSSVSVDGNTFVGALLGLAGTPTGATATPAQLAGTWRVQQPGGAQCQLMLFGQQFQGQYTLAKSGCTAPTLANARGWTVQGGTLSLVAFNEQTANPRVQGLNRADGSGFIIWR